MKLVILSALVLSTMMSSTMVLANGNVDGGGMYQNPKLSCKPRLAAQSGILYAFLYSTQDPKVFSVTVVFNNATTDSRHELKYSAAGLLDGSITSVLEFTGDPQNGALTVMSHADGSISAILQLQRLQYHLSPAYLLDCRK